MLKGERKEEIASCDGVQLCSIDVRVFLCRWVSPTQRDLTWCRIVGFRLQIPTI
jgi:hypothetical protein